jgi:hypothetical protein
MNLLAFVLFVMMLIALMKVHHHKLQVVLCGFAALSIWFSLHHHSVVHWGEHLMEHHRFHLLYNLALLIPGFACVANAFERSGAAHGIAARVTSVAVVLWIVFWLSTVLDNIAAAMIGGVLLMALPGKPSFATLVGVICASNLGGAGSPIGDTTTVMLYLSKDPVVPLWQIFFAFIGSLPAMLAITYWVQYKNRRPNEEGVPPPVIVEGNGDILDEEDLEVAGAADDIQALAEGARHPMQWSLMLHLLGILGLIIGNIAFDQPGLGLWGGLGLGILLSRKGLHVGELIKSVPNTVFLVLLVATAEMLPLDALRPIVAYVGNDATAIGAGLLSAWFDNIPLTALLLQLGNMDWSLVAYCVGYGGSAMWFGSSAGVALGVQFPELYDTKKWWGWTGPFVAVTLTFFVGVAALLVGRLFL